MYLGRIKDRSEGLKGRIIIYISRKDKDRREGLTSMYLGRIRIEGKD